MLNIRERGEGRGKGGERRGEVLRADRGDRGEEMKE